MKNLESFTQPEILRQIGSRRLAKLFDGFRDDLKTASILLPTAESENGSYFDSLARILDSSALPDALRGALFTIEAAAASKNQDRLDSAIQRRIPSVSLSSCCALDRALELWFHAPDELSQFQTGPGNDSQLPSTPGPRPSAPCNDATMQPSNNSPPPPNPTIQQSNNPTIHPTAAATPLSTRDPEPWPEPVDANVLLNKLVRILSLFVVLPKWAAETLALWILHTYAFHLRDVTTYIGLESPEKRCGKTTLLSLLNELANRAVASSNISPPAFFRVIEDLSPALLIDEVDTFLMGNDQLKGILNAGYKKKTAFVLRAAPSPASNAETDAETSATPGVVKRYSCWCPKALAKIGRFPDTLADRCIIIRMQRKTTTEQCERSRELDPTPLKQQCARFVLDHAAEIASAHPAIPPALNDRAADIWEPLLVLADLAGGEWPQSVRQAAVALSANAQETSPIASLLLDICLVFIVAQTDRMFSRTLVEELNARSSGRPWAEMRHGKEIDEAWLAKQLRPYAVRPRTLWIGGAQAKGYYQEDFTETFQRYIPKSDAQAYLDDLRKPDDDSADSEHGGDKPPSPPT